MFRKATKEKLKARIAIDGPAGSGKTYTALRFAFAMAGPGGKVAVIDTEHRSASKYSGESPDGTPFAFDVCELDHYSPSTYVNVIKEAGKAGYDVLVIDSLSHAWEGVGGALDMVDRKAASSKGNSFAAWRDVTPMHRDMVEAILACPCHVIATMRSKMTYELEEYVDDGKKKTRVNKLGLKPIQREGVEYEFDVVADMDLEHILTISKTRCPALDGKKASAPGAAFVAPLLTWLTTGADPVPRLDLVPLSESAAISESTAEQTDTQKPRGGVVLSGKSGVSTPHSQSADDPCGPEIAGKIKEMAQRLKLTPDKIREFASRCGVSKIADMPYREASKLLGKLESKVTEAEVPF